jgi:hypothetical protein
MRRPPPRSRSSFPEYSSCKFHLAGKRRLGHEPNKSNFMSGRRFAPTFSLRRVIGLSAAIIFAFVVISYRSQSQKSHVAEDGGNISASRNNPPPPPTKQRVLTEDERKKGVFLKNYYDCVDKYGSPIETLKLIPLSTEAYLFDKNPYKIAIYFRESKAVKLDYYRPLTNDSTIREEELKAILNANSNGFEWSKSNGLADYVRSDAKVGAYIPRKHGQKPPDQKGVSWRMSVADLEWMEDFRSFKKNSEEDAKKTLEEKRRQELKGL